jgi:RNAse (barnase) inhibitor barstar
MIKFLGGINTKTITINANQFSSLSGFYDEIKRKLTKDLDWEIGRNLDALSDILLGGFGVHEYGEPIFLIWENSEKSKIELGKDFEKIVEVIEYQKNITFFLPC